MRVIPKVVQTLVTKSPDVQRVRDNITSALQPALNFLNQYFAAMPDGSLQITKPTIIQNNTTINGNVVINGTTTMGATSGGGAAFGALSCTSLSSSGAVTAGSFVSPTGFKAPWFGGTYGNSSGAANALYQCTTANAVGTQNRLIHMPFAGSIVGISCQYQGSVTQASIGVQVNKNNASLWPLTTITSGGTGAYGNKSATKGQYAFAANDFLTVLCQFGTAGSVQLQVDLFVEMAA